MKREAELKSDLMKLVRAAGFLELRYATAGAPDKALVRNGQTSNWEFKHATPDFVSHGNQELFCMRLAAHGHCRYVLWQEHAIDEHQRTLIVHPREIKDRVGWAVNPESWHMGFDHRWLLEQIEKVHYS